MALKLPCLTFSVICSVLKDVRIVGHETCGPRETDIIRLRDLPNLNYTSLFWSINRFIDLVPIIQVGQQGIGILLQNN